MPSKLLLNLQPLISPVSSIWLLTTVCSTHLIVASTGHSTRTHSHRRPHRHPLVHPHVHSSHWLLVHPHSHRLLVHPHPHSHRVLTCCFIPICCWFIPIPIPTPAPVARIRPIPWACLHPLGWEELPLHPHQPDRRNQLPWLCPW